MENPLTILVAEDELGDVLLLQRAFQKARVKTPAYFARDGREVVNYLQGNFPFQNPVEHPLPALLLLDLKLPFISGFDVLEWVRSQPGLRHMFVVVLSASDEVEDIKRAYELGANSYLVKPHDPQELVGIVERLQTYWLSINNPAAKQPTAALTLASA